MGTHALSPLRGRQGRRRRLRHASGPRLRRHGLCEPFDPRPYAPDWMLHRSEERYLGFIFDRTKEVDRPQPGDVMVFRYGRCYSHGGIVTCANPVTIIHAFAASGKVIEEDVFSNMALSNPGRLPKFFSYWAAQQ